MNFDTAETKVFSGAFFYFYFIFKYTQCENIAYIMCEVTFFNFI